MLKAKLVVVGGDAKAAEISLSLPTVIGRGREVSLTLPHPLVSRQHCELFEQDGLLHVRDMKSLNGTYIDSRRIESTSALNPNQLLTIGNVTFRAVYSANDASVAERSANASNVIEFDEFNSSADSDSQIDNHTSGSPPFSSRPTEPAKQNPAADQADGHDDVLKTISATDAAKLMAKQKLAEQSNVLDDFAESATPTPQHSIVAALQQVGVNADACDDASINDLRKQLPSDQQANVSNIDGLVVDQEQAPAENVEFSSIDLDETPGDKVESDESALGSFIRKLPR